MMFFNKKENNPYDLSNFTVLLVEDSLYMQSLMISMLKVFGVGDILVCDNGKEAIDLLTVTQARKKSRHVNDVDIILTDWIMPKVSGAELIKWIRWHENDDIRFLPIIVISAYTTEKIVSLARDHGANETLVKPISGTALAARICSVIDNPRQFISAPGYFGPDRRRQDVPYRGHDRRTTKAEDMQVIHGRS
jgi:two-component system chemotaxis response regulator CheY